MGNQGARSASLWLGLAKDEFGENWPVCGRNPQFAESKRKYLMYKLRETSANLALWITAVVKKCWEIVGNLARFQFLSIIVF